MSNNKKILIIISLFLFSGLLFGYLYIRQTKNLLSPQEAAQKAITFINKNMLPEGATASLISVLEEGGIYKFHFKIAENEYDSYVTKNGKLLFTSSINLENQPQSNEKQTIGDFLVSEKEVCQENGKPIIYFFGSQTCPHCQWEHPLIQEIVLKFKDYIIFRDRMDSQEDIDIFKKYSTGGIPTIVLGCKYTRQGSGESSGVEEEKKVLTALICDLTKKFPADVCNPVQDLINQIYE